MNGVLSGKVVIVRDVAPFSGGDIHITVEEVSRADAPSRIIAEKVLRNVQHGQERRDETFCEFTLHLPPELVIDAKASYSLRVWIDRDGDGKAGQDDLFSSEACPVLTRGFGKRVFVIVK